MQKPLPNRSIMCIDMKCFYASCIAMLEGLDVMKVPIAVIANFQQPGSVVLAASPPMKERFHIKTGNRRFEIPKHPDIRLFEPKMSFFLDMSVAITCALGVGLKLYQKEEAPSTSRNFRRNKRSDFG